MVRENPSPAIEDYLQAIYGLTAEGEAITSARLARRVRVTSPTAWATVRRMDRDGLVTLDSKKVISLTSKGRELAENIVRRHRLAERFLTDVLGLAWSDVHEEAHRFEHAISPLVEERIIALLENPTTCPHGLPIPRSGAVLPSDLLTLDRLSPGDTATIAFISEALEEDTDLLHYLERGQIMPGHGVRLLEKAGGVVIVQINGAQVPLAMDVAANVRVRPVTGTN